MFYALRMKYEKKNNVTAFVDNLELLMRKVFRSKKQDVFLKKNLLTAIKTEFKIWIFTIPFSFITAMDK